MRIPACSVLAVLLVLASCTGDDDSAGAPDDDGGTGVEISDPGSGDSTELDDGDERGDDAEAVSIDPPAWGPCADFEEVECATISVPLVHADPDAGTIDLVLARRPALDADNRIGSLLTNPGGPGASGVEFIGNSPYFDEALQGRFDIVSWDPRGVGRSTSVTCGTNLIDDLFRLDPIPDDAVEAAALDAAAAAFAAECAQQDGDLLPHLGSRASARDIDAIRRSLGEDLVTYVGLSYGTVLGQLYLDEYPDRVRAMVLDGVVDLADDEIESSRRQLMSFEASFLEMMRSCTTECPIDGDPVAAFDRLFAQVDGDPLPDGDGIELVGQAEVETAALQLTYLSDAWPLFHLAVAEGQDGNGNLLDLFAEAYWDGVDFPAFYAIGCGGSAFDEEDFVEYEAAMVETSARFGQSYANRGLPCKHWPVSGDDEVLEIAAPTAPPVLVVGNTGDNATPYENAVDVAERLVSGVLVTYEGQGHLTYGKSDCADTAIDAYLIDLTLPADGMVCT